MTEQQIDLEFELIHIEKARKDGKTEVFEDDTFDEYDKESEEIDRLPSTIASSVPPGEILRKTTTKYNENEWEAVE